MPSVFFPNFLIGLREGLEAGLVVSILVAFLVKSNRTEKLRWVALGVTGAVLFSVGSWFCITYIFTNIDSFRQQELTGGLLSLIAIVFVTGMIFWMRSTGRKLKRELSSKLEAALAVGSLAVVAMSFLAVGREGLETSIFIWSASQAADQQVYPLLGALSGIAASVVLAYLIYRSAVKVNLSKFFTVTGVGLIVVAAGIAGYGIHDLQEAGYLPGLNHLAWDISSFYDESSWYGALLGGVFNVKAQTTVLQAIMFFAYLVVVMTFFLWPHGKTTKPASATDAADAESERTDKGVLEPAGAGTGAPQ